MESYKVDLETAIGMLPDRGDIHTFRNPSGGMLVGADWSRADVVEAIRKYGAELSGEQATRMKHGLVVKDSHGHVFIETVGVKDEN